MKLGITPSNSRPRVSNDNPYSESLFKTLNYRTNYQPKVFESLEDARAWCKLFVYWYRFEHHHSGIKFLTSAERHAGKSEEILNHRIVTCGHRDHKFLCFGELSDIRFSI